MLGPTDDPSCSPNRSRECDPYRRAIPQYRGRNTPASPIGQDWPYLGTHACNSARQTGTVPCRPCMTHDKGAVGDAASHAAWCDTMAGRTARHCCHSGMWPDNVRSRPHHRWSGQRPTHRRRTTPPQRLLPLYSSAFLFLLFLLFPSA
jgi:hypothetical protein